jgi:hypothetical protein
VTAFAAAPAGDPLAGAVDTATQLNKALGIHPSLMDARADEDENHA